ncbi:MAG: hypothetical protein IPM39_24955 [Chloroflexi bacterium]|nr:hypothetical protein [Chloroflexota bacterium]
MALAHQLILQTSYKVEYYTDPLITAAARRVMGSIDLDPASSPTANQTIMAGAFFSAPEPQLVSQAADGLPVYQIAKGGLAHEWHGNIWMNHPFGARESACKSRCQKNKCPERGFHIANNQPGNEDWIAHLVTEYSHGHIQQACCITWASTSETWFRPLYDGLMCNLIPRTGYILPDGTKKPGATKGSVVTYFGDNWQAFVQEFAPLGAIPNQKLLDRSGYNQK